MGTMWGEVWVRAGTDDGADDAQGRAAPRTGCEDHGCACDLIVRMVTIRNISTFIQIKKSGRSGTSLSCARHRARGRPGIPDSEKIALSSVLTPTG